MRAVCALLAVTLAALAADDKWARLKSPNFELYTDGGAGPARDVLKRFEQIRQAFEQISGKKNLASVPVRIFLFRSEPSFRPYRMSEDKNRVGYYQAGAERDYIAMQNTGEGSYRTVFHEYAHMIVNHTWPRIPTWCEEGVAEVYSTLRVTGNEVHVGDLIPSHLLVLREKKILDLASLMMIDQSSAYYNEAQKAGIFYAESWALAHMLIMNESYRGRFPGFIELLVNGTPQPDAFVKAFGKTLDAGNRDLREYVVANRYTGRLYRAEAQSKLEKIEPEVVSAFESRALLADLLLATRRWTEAQATYAELARANPQSPLPESGLGALAYRAKDYDGALSHYAKALELGADDARTHLEYAELLERKEADPAALRQHLAKAVELSPTYSEARVDLGRFLSEQGEHKAALDHLAKAAEFSPRQPEIWIELAIALHRAGSEALAEGALRRARQASTSETLSEVERARDWIKRDTKAVRASAQSAKLVPLPKVDPAAGPVDPAAKPPSPEEPPAGPAKPDEPDERPTQKRPSAANPVTKDADAATDRGSIEVSEHWARKKGDKRIQGKLMQVDCLGNTARFHVIADGLRLKLLIRDPAKVLTNNDPSVSLEFACGPQDLRRVTSNTKALRIPALERRERLRRSSFGDARPRELAPGKPLREGPR